jgi:N-acylneuraminate cytidylyltransferase
MNLVLIPARGGSKGVPNKNIKILGSQPLIGYSIDIAKKCFPDDVLCVSTDSPQIRNVAEELGVYVPFLRPTNLATDIATTDQVILHAINYYKVQGIQLDNVILLQPTSPFRTEDQLREAFTIYNNNTADLLVSVCETESNPYYNLFEEDNLGFLVKSKQSSITRRQDLPSVYELNGAIYIFKVASFLTSGSLGLLSKRIKYLMDKKTSIDIDTPLDWKWCEFLIKQKYFDI